MNVKKTVLLVSITLVTITTTYFLEAIIIRASSPDDVVKTFWQLCLDNKLEEAESLTTSQLGASANIREPVDFVSRDISEFDCCMSNAIGEQQIKIDDIIETKSGKYNSGVLLNTTNKNGKKEKYFAYLTLTSENLWRINRVSLLNQEEDGQSTAN